MPTMQSMSRGGNVLVLSWWILDCSISEKGRKGKDELQGGTGDACCGAASLGRATRKDRPSRISNETPIR